MINNISPKNPYVLAWWSAAFPGFGHLILGHYAIGIVLILHEIIINTLAGLNTAIYYSMIGEIETAKQSLNMKWIIAYISPYVFAIWDCYQRALGQNEDAMIAQKKGTHIISNEFSAFGLNRLEQKKPIVSLVWSFLAPFSGHIYINRTPIVLVVPWLVLVVHLSNLLPAIHYSFIGDFNSAINSLDPQWLLYLPSLYGFAVYDAYVHTLEYNSLCKMYQKDLLESLYQSKDFPINTLKISKEK